MRKSSCYGLENKSVDFEWPKPSDLRQMANKKLIKLAQLNYNQGSTRSDRFGAFQVILSNGESSPVFAAKD